MKRDFELLNELYSQRVSEAAPLAAAAAGLGREALKGAAMSAGAQAASTASEDPRMLNASVDDDFNDTSNELGDKLKSANVEMFSDMIAKAIEELINSTTDDNSPLGKKDCVDMIMASAQRYLDEGSCNRH